MPSYFRLLKGMKLKPSFSLTYQFSNQLVCPLFGRKAKLGAAYLGLRSLYAPVWLIFGGEAGCPNPGIAPITFTQYAINMYSTMAVILKLAFEKDISSFFFGYDALGVVAFTGAYMMYAVGGIVNVNLAIKGYFDESKRPKTA